MIIVKIIGGLGNQLFQYAFGRKLALKNNTELKLDISGFRDYKIHKYGLHHFNIIENIISEKDLMGIKIPFFPLKFFFIGENCKLKGNNTLLYFKEPHFNYDPNISKLTNNVYLDGYWQSEKYFAEISRIILKEFSVKNEPDELNRKMLTIINSTNSVSLHIRRGDYISNPHTKEIHGVIGMEYYRKSLNLMEEKVKDPQIFVFSDDITWVRENLRTDLPLHFIDHNGVEKNYEDLRLMSNCKHHIIANSSFSWWGAWLGTNADKITIAPSIWVNDPSRDMSDIVPDEWIKI